MVNGLANNAEIDDSSNCDATVVLLKKGNRVEPGSKEGGLGGCLGHHGWVGRMLPVPEQTKGSLGYILGQSYLVMSCLGRFPEVLEQNICWE